MFLLVSDGSTHPIAQRAGNILKASNDHFDVTNLFHKHAETLIPFLADGAMDNILSAKKKGINLNLGFSAHSDERH
jgi:predicted aldo/keto reductase-like oxidoreductase